MSSAVGKFLIVNVPNIKALLAEVQTDIFLSDREMIVEGLLDGSLKESISDFKNIATEDLIKEMDFIIEFLYGECGIDLEIPEDGVAGIMLYDEAECKLHLVDVGDFAQIRDIALKNVYVKDGEELPKVEKEEPKEPKEPPVKLPGSGVNSY